MNTYSTAHTTHPLGRWLAALAVSLVLLALAYAHAPDPAGQLGFGVPSARTLANSRPALQPQRGYHLAPNQASPLATAQLRQPTKIAAYAQLAR